MRHFGGLVPLRILHGCGNCASGGSFHIGLLFLSRVPGQFAGVILQKAVLSGGPTLGGTRLLQRLEPGLDDWQYLVVKPYLVLPPQREPLFVVPGEGRLVEAGE